MQLFHQKSHRCGIAGLAAFVEMKLSKLGFGEQEACRTGPVRMRY
jgi:hypothetical protein